MKLKRYFRFRHDLRQQVVVTPGWGYLKFLNEMIDMPYGLYRVMRAKTGPWRFVKHVQRTDEAGTLWTYFVLQHQDANGDWLTIDAPEWCQWGIQEYGLDQGERFMVRKVR